MKKAALVLFTLCLVFASFSPAQADMQTLNPYDGSYMGYVGTLDDGINPVMGGNDVYDNSISQTIAPGTSTISLWYNFFTWDYPPYDAPGFVIKIDGNTVLSYDAYDLSPNDDGYLDSTGWTYFSHGVTSADPHTLTIYAGNTGDDSVQSFVFIDYVNPLGSSTPTGDGLTGGTFGVGDTGTSGFINGGFEYGSLSGWSSTGDAGVLGQFDYDPEGDDGPPVPVPAAVWLLGSGLLGLLGLRKKISA